MFYNLKITFRNLRGNGLYSIINIIGLSVSLAACAFIFLWIQDEKSYDQFHHDADEIYMGIAHIKNDKEYEAIGITDIMLPQMAKESFNEVKSFCTIRNYSTGFIKYENVTTESKQIIATDSNFFDFFDFSILKGHTEGLLKNPEEIVINEYIANELFGSEDPIGKIVSLDDGGNFQVVAVIKNFPTNTSIPHADMIVSKDADPMNKYMKGWNSCEFSSFLRITPGTDTDRITKKVSSLQPSNFKAYRYYTLQPLINMHLYGNDGEPTNFKTVQIFSWIAYIILVIACINYVNLITARSSKKNREIGLKKVLGANKIYLFFQLMAEAILLFFVSLVVAILMNIILIDVFNQFSGKEIYYGWNNWDIWKIYGFMFVAVIFLAGIYPALSLSSFKLINMLHGKLTNTGNGGFRKSLVVIQFIASIILIAVTVTLESQLSYIRQKNLGFDKEHVLTCQSINMAEHFSVVKEELLRNPAIKSVTGGSDLSHVTATNTTEEWEGKAGDGSLYYHRLFVDSTFFNTLSMKFADGSEFSSGDEKQVIINETAAKEIGISEPIVGKWIYADHAKRTIIGVIKDFHFNSLYNKIPPAIIFNSSDYVKTIYIRTTAHNTRETISSLEKLWKKYNPDYKFNYSFMDDSFEQLYRSDIRTGRLFGTFSFIAILICCLGLFGLVTFTTETKNKEIGIRKILGASVSDIIQLISKEFIILIGVSLLIALPLASHFMDKILQNYAYRISINWMLYIWVIFIIVTLTFIAIGWKAIKSATANPVNSIKSE